MPLDLACRVTFLVYRDVRIKIRNHTSNSMYLSHQKFINDLCSLLLTVSISKKPFLFGRIYLYLHFYIQINLLCIFVLFFLDVLLRYFIIYILLIIILILFQGHIGENPFDNGSWGKEHFQPSTVPWQLNPRGHGRPSVSVFANLLRRLYL